MAKINLNKKALSDRVVEFMTTKVWSYTLTDRYNAEKKDIEKGIESTKKLVGSIHESNIEETINGFNKKLVELNEKLKKEQEEKARFKFSEADNSFYNEYKKATTNAQIHSALVRWFATFDVDATVNPMFVNDLMVCFSGKAKGTKSLTLKSDGTRFNREKRTKTDVLVILYGELAEIMIKKGSIKPVAIPEDMREKYILAPARKKAEKAAKKAAEKKLA